MAHLNFLEPHLATILGFIGLTGDIFIRAGYEEYKTIRQNGGSPQQSVRSMKPG